MVVDEAASRPEGTLVPDHPARFSRAILDVLGRLLVAEHQSRGPLKVLDCFAGVGGVHSLAQEGIETFGVELQPEYAAAHPDTICGSVLDVPLLFPGPPPFDCITTSPSFGNRMADAHDAQERCSACAGSGTVKVHPVDGPSGIDLGEATTDCTACAGKGSRDYRRNTYTHALARSGVEIVRSIDNSALMQFGPKYRDFHEKAWRACDRVLRPGGLVLLDVKNFVRAGKVVRVVEAHLNAWLMLGYTLEEAKRVPTRGLAYGSNHEARVPAELVLVMRKPAS